MDSAFNKIATLIKFRYGQPDEYLYVNLKRIHKEAKKNPEYSHSKIKILVDKLLGDHNYKLITASRAQLDHALDPDYTNSKKLNQRIKFEKIACTIFSIIDEIFNDHLEAEIKIEDKDVVYYRIKEILSVPETKSEELDTVVRNSIDYQIEAKELLHLIGNYADHVHPYIIDVANINPHEKKLITSFLPILSDITFRFHEATRSFMYFLLLRYTGNWKEHLGEEISSRLTESDSSYFMYVSTFSMYSIYDKTGNFLSYIYPVSREKTYFKYISERIIESESINNDLKQVLKKLLASPSYKAIDLLRQQTSHGWDLAIQQKEGTIFSTEYFTLALYHNFKNIILIINKICYIYPDIARTILISNGIKIEVFEQILKKAIDEENEYMNELEKKYDEI